MWEEVYRAAFPGFMGMHDLRDDGWWQRAGIDRSIVLSNSKTVLVDEKVRKKDWGDILLEYFSDEARKTPGWVRKDLACDFIAYAFLPSRKCYLLPFLQLRRAWDSNGRRWFKQYEIIRADNGNYKTASVAVPTDVLLAALTDAMLVRWEQ